MTDPPHSEDNATLHERLVAYLDRELPPDESEAVEATIAADEAARSTLDGLDRAWQALDVLPVERTEADFTRTTMAMAASGARPRGPADGEPGWLPATARRLLGPALVAAAAATLVVAAVWLPQRRTLERLPVALTSDALRQFDDAAYLLRLADTADDLKLAAQQPSITAQADLWRSVDQMTLGERRQWLDNLSGSQLETVSRQVAAYESDRRDAAALARRHAALMNNTEAAQLTRMVAAYGAFTASLKPAEQADLREASQDQRLRVVPRQLRRWRLDQATQLTAGEQLALSDHLQEVARGEAVGAALDNLLPRGGRRGQRDHPRRFVEAKFRRAPAAALARVGRFVLRTSTDKPPQATRRDRLSGHFAEQLRPSWPAIESAVVRGLPAAVQRVIASDDLQPRERTELVVSILQHAATHSAAGDLPTQFDELSNEQLSRYLTMPTEQIVAELEGEDDASFDLGGPMGGPPFPPPMPRGGAGPRGRGFPGPPPSGNTPDDRPRGRRSAAKRDR